MADRPILFSAPMIRALLEGRKTQTRRVIKPQPPADVIRHCWYDAPIYGFTKDLDVTGNWHKARLLGYKGDRLWVRESHIPDPPSDDPSWGDNTCTYVEWSGCGSKISDIPLALRQPAFVLYAADDRWTGYPMQWKPSIHMPRWASRLTLIVTDVRVERLQDISEEDAKEEGITEHPCLGPHRGPAATFWTAGDGSRAEGAALSPKLAFAALWDGINGPGAWGANPWVAAYTFRVIKSNIDEVSP